MVGPAERLQPLCRALFHLGKAGVNQVNRNRQLSEAVRFLREKSRGQASLCLVSGSGWSSFVDSMDSVWSCPYSEIPFFPVPTVEGHRGRLLQVRLATGLAYVLEGRVHLYEGRSPAEVAFPVRTIAGLGTRTFVLTNAAGAVNPRLKVGQLMFLSDQLNLQGCSPLDPVSETSSGAARFVDLTDAFDRELLEIARQMAQECNHFVDEGVYLGVRGPNFETPAEIRAFRVLGADAVGMSTIQEVIALRELGRRVLGLSLISNLGAGLGPNPPAHDQVIHKVSESVRGYVGFLTALLDRIASQETHPPE